MKLSGQIDHLRKLKDVSIKDLAVAAKSSAPAVGKYLRGETDIGSSKLVNICKYLGVDVSSSVTKELRSVTGLIDPEDLKDDKDLVLLFSNLDAVSKKIVLTTLVKTLSKRKEKNLQDAIKRFKVKLSSL